MRWAAGFVLIACSVFLLPARDIKIVGRAQVSESFDIVVSLTKQNLRLTLQDRSKPSLWYLIAEEASECDAVLERATSGEVVVSCTPEKGMRGSHRKFVYDLGAKALVKAFDVAPSPATRIVINGGRVTLIGPETAFDLFPTPRVSKPWPQPELPKPPQIKLPQSTYSQFAAARPKRVTNGYLRETTTIEEHIGPWQQFKGQLWFAKGFYDGEGMSGVGGFGFMERRQLKRVWSPPEIVDYSGTALLVEDDTVWIGLAFGGEWRSYPAGLLRFDRTTEKAEKIDFPDLIGAIQRFGNRLILATDMGAAIYENGTFRRYFVDQTSDGRLRVAEAVR